MKESTSKVKRQPSEWQEITAKETTDGINLQIIQAAHAAQYQKNKTIQSKIGQTI